MSVTLLRLTPRTAVWRQTLACWPDPDLLVASATEVGAWLQNGVLATRVLSKAQLDDVPHALILTPDRDPGWVPWAALDNSDGSADVLLVHTTDVFGSRAATRWDPCAVEDDSTWVQLSISEHEVFFRRWEPGQHAPSGPVLMASIYDIIEKYESSLAGHDAVAGQEAQRSVEGSSTPSEYWILRFLRAVGDGAYCQPSSSPSMDAALVLPSDEPMFADGTADAPDAAHMTETSSTVVTSSDAANPKHSPRESLTTSPASNPIVAHEQAHEASVFALAHVVTEVRNVSELSTTAIGSQTPQAREDKPGRFSYSHRISDENIETTTAPHVRFPTDSRRVFDHSRPDEISVVSRALPDRPMDPQSLPVDQEHKDEGREIKLKSRAEPTPRVNQEPEIRLAPDGCSLLPIANLRQPTRGTIVGERVSPALAQAPESRRTPTRRPPPQGPAHEGFPDTPQNLQFDPETTTGAVSLERDGKSGINAMVPEGVVVQDLGLPGAIEDRPPLGFPKDSVANTRQRKTFHATPEGLPPTTTTASPPRSAHATSSAAHGIQGRERSDAPSRSSPELSTREDAPAPTPVPNIPASRWVTPRISRVESLVPALTRSPSSPSDTDFDVVVGMKASKIKPYPTHDRISQPSHRDLTRKGEPVGDARPLPAPKSSQSARSHFAFSGGDPRPAPTTPTEPLAAPVGGRFGSLPSRSLMNRWLRLEHDGKHPPPRPAAASVTPAKLAKATLSPEPRRGLVGRKTSQTPTHESFANTPQSLQTDLETTITHHHQTVYTAFGERPLSPLNISEEPSVADQVRTVVASTPSTCDDFLSRFVSRRGEFRPKTRESAKAAASSERLSTVLKPLDTCEVAGKDFWQNEPPVVTPLRSRAISKTVPRPAPPEAPMVRPRSHVTGLLSRLHEKVPPVEDRVTLPLSSFTIPTPRWVPQPTTRLAPTYQTPEVVHTVEIGEITVGPGFPEVSTRSGTLHAGALLASIAPHRVAGGRR